LGETQYHGMAFIKTKKTNEDILRWLANQYIRQGAKKELNIPSSVRKAVSFS
jgi:hypothetical protein